VPEPPTAVTSVELFHNSHHVVLATRALICMVTLIFDLLTSKLVRIIAHGWVFKGLFVLDLWSNTYQMHHVTLRP